MLISGGKIWYNSCRSSGKAGVAQWQSSSLPSWLRGFDSLRPLQGRFSQGGVMAAAADSKSAVREYVRVRVPPLAPAFAPCGATAGKPDRRTEGREGCPSGRWCNLGKVVWAQVHRGFESPPLRQWLYLNVISSRRRCGTHCASRPTMRRWRKVSAASPACRRKGAGGRRGRQRSAALP